MNVANRSNDMGIHTVIEQQFMRLIKTQDIDKCHRAMSRLLNAGIQTQVASESSMMALWKTSEYRGYEVKTNI